MASSINHAETSSFDPRYGRGQSVEDAKARYLHQDGYSLNDFESDLDRLLHTGNDRPTDQDEHGGGR